MEVRASLARRPSIRLSQLSAWDHELQSGVRVCRHGRDIRHAGSEGAAHVQSDPGAVLLVVGHEGVIGHGPAEAHQDGPHIREERGGVSRPGREKPSEDGCRQQYGWNKVAQDVACAGNTDSVRCSMAECNDAGQASVMQSAL